MHTILGYNAIYIIKVYNAIEIQTRVCLSFLSAAKFIKITVIMTVIKITIKKKKQGLQLFYLSPLLIIYHDNSKNMKLPQIYVLSSVFALTVKIKMWRRAISKLRLFFREYDEYYFFSFFFHDTVMTDMQFFCLTLSVYRTSPYVYYKNCIFYIYKKV